MQYLPKHGHRSVNSYLNIAVRTLRMGSLKPRFAVVTQFDKIAGTKFYKGLTKLANSGAGPPSKPVPA